MGRSASARAQKRGSSAAPGIWVAEFRRESTPIGRNGTVERVGRRPFIFARNDTRDASSLLCTTSRPLVKPTRVIAR